MCHELHGYSRFLGDESFGFDSPHRNGLLGHDKDPLVQLHSEDPGQLNNYFLRKTVRRKRGLKLSVAASSF